MERLVYFAVGWSVPAIAYVCGASFVQALCLVATFWLGGASALSLERWFRPLDTAEGEVISAKRGDEDLHVRVVTGQEHPNPAMMYVLLEVRLGPDVAE